ncbi:2-oxoisovalerate dehydrogenase subunit alpha 2, mitochondrial-like [Micractinium conductrix]|uniref:3-methyl-2-oxobutanoate dehydrogenase (2-methylpropanoyl-transferring) n=1 Tax=Micractinium conductrix TaxID=554055 RepID=A0A2P6VPI3_9CHLO|nr:2-oxoisovalerate dehydrogenase subunit alpha 2, mitochondrial-like [Micractinium conductrix]|eukprot:PSC75990.1 2-oxoisovalerate dehydrogenase subunit alpha 2, mitochondrial-like [Micractinium conductrix]
MLTRASVALRACSAARGARALAAAAAASPPPPLSPGTAGGEQPPSGAPASAAASPTAADDRMDFPGGSVPFSRSPAWVGGAFSPRAPLPCYRTLDASGREVPGAAVPHPLSREVAVKMYETMVRLQTADTIFYEAQRQGRFSFYMTSSGEEATAIGSAAALSPDDVVFSQYREQGVIMYRGFTLLDMANQCFGNMHEQGRGRQMPIHYGSRALNFHTISSTLTTQLPHAVGAAYALKLDKRDAVAVAYFGDGAASEGDFHAALNFAATLGAPVIFVCRNNGWAISTPATDQYRGDGIAGRGPGYGVATLRVDGGDAIAVYNATAEARRVALEQQAPVLLEAMSYRSGHHSTSDDSSRYRAAEEMRQWRARDPVARFQRWLVDQGWWDDAADAAARQAARREVIQALEAAQKAPKPPLSSMFEDVYAEMPWHLEAQQRQVMAHVAAHPDACPADIPVK